MLTHSDNTSTTVTAVTTEPPSSITETLHPPPSILDFPSALPERTGLPACRGTFDPRPSTLAPRIIDATPVPATPARQRNKSRRTGRIAVLPKLQRDMVNRMISNGVPYKNIVGALDEAGFNVSERNVSAWATGGYLEWQLEQDLVVQNRHDQDHLVDHLRRDDASELPEVGLQAAATRLSQILLQKTAGADDLEANLGNVSQMVDLLCRLNCELSVLQKQRDDSRRSLGRAHDPARIKDMDEKSALDHERFYSNPPSDVGLAKPDQPPLLPPVPTSSFLAETDDEDAQVRKAARTACVMASLQAFAGKSQNDAHPPKPSLPASSATGSLANALPPVPPTSTSTRSLPAPEAARSAAVGCSSL